MLDSHEKGWAEALRKIADAKDRNLDSLDLSDLGLTQVPSEIGQLTQLTSLDLDSNQLSSLPPEIDQLTHLTGLSLRGNQLSSLPPEIGQLTQLTDLSLSSNQLSSLPPEIGQLIQLTDLSLSSNQLSSLPPEIGQLTHLRVLSLSGNQLGSLTPEIGQLVQLTYLFLSGNQLRSLPREIGQLTQLTDLFVSTNGLSRLPPEIGKLTRLTHLFLKGNQLSSIPPEIGQLTQLTHLDLADNQLASLPPEISNLLKLRSLMAQSNQLTNLPADLSRLGLKSLSLYGNRLDTIDAGLIKRVPKMTLSNNPFSGVPKEIKSQGVNAIKAYLLDKKREKPSKAKLILVGGAEFGKSSLLKTLKGEVVAKGQLSQTHGIEIRQLDLTHPNSADRKLHLNAWDFGGQVIYHATHQFFLSDHSLFILVWSARRGVQQADLPYWLDMIRARAPNAKVLLVATHIDEAKSVDLDFDSLRRQYADLLHSRYFAVSSTERTNIPELLGTIAELAAKIRAVDYEWPSSWIKAAKTLCARTEDLLPLPDVKKIFVKDGLTDEAAQGTLLRWLHELGDIVYYPEVEGLEEIVILKPEWVTKQVAAILDDQEVKDSKGVLKQEHVARLWSTVDVPFQKVLGILMDHYDLTYPTKVNSDRIVVECLQHKPTDFLQRWQKRESQPQIQCRYHFDPRFQPGIPTWFIARAHRYTTNNQWRNGALFEDDQYNSACLMEADPEHASVTITVRGPNPPYFFSVMDRTFADTLAPYQGLQYKIYIPCPCGGKPGDPSCSHEFDRADLIHPPEGADPTDQMQCPKTRRMVSISKILNGVYTDSYKSIQDKLEQLLVGQSQQLEEFRASFALLQNQFTLDLLRKQNELDRDAPGVFTLAHPMFGSVDSTVQAWKRSLIDAKGEELELCLFCEFPGEWHATEHSHYQFRPTAEWVADVAPYWSPLQKVLKTCAPILKAAGKAKFPVVGELVSRGLEAVAELSGISGDNRDFAASHSLVRTNDPIQVWETARVTLRELLQEFDQKRPAASRWGGLRQTHMPSGEILWLCQHHKMISK